MTTNTLNQNQLRQQARAQLAIIGGALVKDQDAVYEGRRFVFPEQYLGDGEGLIRDVAAYVRGEEEEVLVDKIFEYLYLDGAHAVYHKLVEYFGYARSVAKQGMFGPQPPSEVSVPTGFENGVLQEVTVPVGDMLLPGMPGARLTISSVRLEQNGPLLLRLVARVQRWCKPEIEGFYQEVTEYLKINSIYKGKAFYGNMDFIDVDRIDPNKFVYSEQAQREAETHIFSPMVHADLLDQRGLEKRRVVLLEGGYGTGKSGMGRIAAKIAQANGWTAIIARPGQDDPFAVLEIAKLYQRAGSKGVLVFIEDVDTIANNFDPMYVTRLLDAFDGVSTKDLRMVLVMTTNHADKIHKGMLRPGRIHGMIHIGEMDQPAVEKLAKMVIGDELEGDIDWSAVHAATIGYTPAFVREGLERAIRFSISRTGKVSAVATVDLVGALDSVRPQHELMTGASDRVERPSLDSAFRQMVKETAGIDYDEVEIRAAQAVFNKMEKAQVIKPDSGNQIGVIVTDY